MAFETKNKYLFLSYNCDKIKFNTTFLKTHTYFE